ncbi:Gfo/Idh/MocA family oxidoreductase [Herbiconiux sp.]|uniref:Gfo/Idh/MocA family protein n=1 Tax=Herbiconiux sp. TaxID=1871186 RepID=UPI0025C1971E|nr:Gfo/Idh/MocA family oxidoreductase [Herbiconiux sp.]
MRLGMIGAGFHTSTNIAPALQLAGIPLAALATRDRARSREALTRFGQAGGIPYGSAAELLADDSLDGVIVVAQPGDQLQLTLDALAAGKHVFVDKPLGWNAQEAAAVADAADAAGRDVMVGFMKRYAPVYLRLRELIESGDLGTIRSSSLRFGCDSTPFCADDEQFVKLAAIHMVDLVRFLFGEVVTVSALSTGHGSHVALSILLGFESGAAGTLDLTGLPSRSSETESLVVTGDLGYATTSESAALSVHLAPAPDATSAPSWKTLTESTTTFTPAESAMSGAGRDLHLRGFVGELEAFVACIAAGTAPTSSAHDNVATMALIDRILAVRA